MQKEQYRILGHVPTIEEHFALRKGVGWMLFDFAVCPFDETANH